MRVKVNSFQEGMQATAALNTGLPGMVGNSWLNLKPDSTSWGLFGYKTDFSAEDNSDNFHDFRVALEPGTDTYSVWRDGLLLGENIPSGENNDLNRIVFGDMGGLHGGDFDVDYLRFTSGAYAPVDFIYPEQPVKPERPGAVAGGPVIDGGTTPYAWYRADQGVVLWENTEEDQVAWLCDQSGNNRHLEAIGTVGVTDSGVNETAALTFNGGSDSHLDGLIADWGVAQPGTIFLVCSRKRTCRDKPSCSPVTERRRTDTGLSSAFGAAITSKPVEPSMKVVTTTTTRWSPREKSAWKRWR